MLQYTIKRLLLMPPTFFLVSLVIFIVLNVAPGRPGASAAAAESGESSDSANQRKSFYRRDVVVPPQRRSGLDAPEDASVLTSGELVDGYGWAR